MGKEAWMAPKCGGKAKETTWAHRWLARKLAKLKEEWLVGQWLVVWKADRWLGMVMGWWWAKWMVAW